MQSMASHTENVSKAMQQWLEHYSCRPSDELKELCKITLTLEDSGMLTSPEQLQFLGFLATSIGAKRAIEVGVFTGASALAIAEVLPADGVIVACDLTDEYLQYASPAWEAAGVTSKIDFRVGDALDTLQTLVDGGQSGTFDFMYIDADKINSQNYYELGLTLLRSGGIITIDNMFYGGQVADDSFDDENTVATRNLTTFLHQDDRIDFSLIPIGDGLALIRKR